MLVPVTGKGFCLTRQILALPVRQEEPAPTRERSGDLPAGMEMAQAGSDGAGAFPLPLRTPLTVDSSQLESPTVGEDAPADTAEAAAGAAAIAEQLATALGQLSVALSSTAQAAEHQQTEPAGTATPPPQASVAAPNAQGVPAGMDPSLLMNAVTHAVAQLASTGTAPTQQQQQQQPGLSASQPLQIQQQQQRPQQSLVSPPLSRQGSHQSQGGLNSSTTPSGTTPSGLLSPTQPQPLQQQRPSDPLGLLDPKELNALVQQHQAAAAAAAQQQCNGAANPQQPGYVDEVIVWKGTQS